MCIHRYPTPYDEGIYYVLQTWTNEIKDKDILTSYCFIPSSWCQWFQTWNHMLELDSAQMTHSHPETEHTEALYIYITWLCLSWLARHCPVLNNWMLSLIGETPLCCWGYIIFSTCQNFPYLYLNCTGISSVMVVSVVQVFLTSLSLNLLHLSAGVWQLKH